MGPLTAAVKEVQKKTIASTTELFRCKIGKNEILFSLLRFLCFFLQNKQNYIIVYPDIPWSNV